MCVCARAQAYTFVYLNLSHSTQVMSLFFVSLNVLLVKLCEVAVSLLCARCSVLSVFLFFFPLFFPFMLLFQAVSPQLPHAGSSDIHFSLYTSSPSPLSSSSSFPHLPAERSQVSIWFGTLTSLSCFSSFFPFKAQNLSPSLSL